MQIDDECKDIVKQKCEKESNLFFSTPCRSHCNKLPDNCKKSFKNFCSNIKNRNDCIVYCNIEENKDACLKYISENCTGNKIITDRFCQSTSIIASSKDNDNYEQLMKSYCNSNGKQKDLTKIPVKDYNLLEKASVLACVSNGNFIVASTDQNIISIWSKSK
jgi:hypothetical protein